MTREPVGPLRLDHLIKAGGRATHDPDKRLSQ
jgi:hypothetical protein